MKSIGVECVQREEAIVGESPVWCPVERALYWVDITGQKMAVEALAELSRRTERRERILTSTLSFISDFAYIYDRDGRFLFVNQPLLDLWGVTLEDAVGKNFFDLGYPR